MRPTRFLVVLFLLARPVALTSQDETNREVMWSKLDLSHDSLDALVLEDFEALEAYAADLETLADATATYILDDNTKARAVAFRVAARALKDAAMNRHAEAGAIAYWDLTLRCIRCHRDLGATPR